MIIAWLLGKLAFYFAMAAFAIAWCRFYVRSPAKFIAMYGLIRFAMGFLAAFLIGFLVLVVVPPTSAGWLSYPVSFGGVRYIEWTLVLAMMAWTQDTSFFELRWRGQVWILIGVLGNLGFDALAAVMKLTDSIKWGC